jgi:hypothetical protein
MPGLDFSQGKSNIRMQLAAPLGCFQIMEEALGKGKGFIPTGFQKEKKKPASKF